MSDATEEKKPDDIVVTHGKGGLPSFVNATTISMAGFLLFMAIVLTNVLGFKSGEMIAIGVVCLAVIFLMGQSLFARIFFGGGGVMLIIASGIYLLFSYLDRWQATWDLPRKLTSSETTLLQWSGPMFAIWFIMVASSLTVAYTKWKVGILGAILPSLLYSWWYGNTDLWLTAAVVGAGASVGFRLLSTGWGAGISKISSIKNQQLTMWLSTMYSSMVTVFYSPLQTWTTLFLSDSPEAAVAIFFGFGVGGTVASFLLAKIRF